MLESKYEKQFKKDLKVVKRRGYDMDLIFEVIELLLAEDTLPQKYQDHALIKNKKYRNVRECHILPDWLLVYRVEKELELLRLVRTGTHSDLFCIAF
ncbi:type II toxin-antitoxin system YafQ family toxin [Candidatus Saccharibacteria bacterium]|nr:type II toxin-antitoxin system YafQ family toxin [Candidatus Saccharibacteria bacterium]